MISLGHKNKNRGFTLIEVLIAVAIMAVLFGVAAPLLNDYSSGLAAEADDEQLKNAISKARNYARVNNVAVNIENDTLNNRIRVVEATTVPTVVVGVYPIENKTVAFTTAGTTSTTIQVANSGAFNGQNQITLSYDGNSKILTLLRSGRLE